MPTNTFSYITEVLDRAIEDAQPIDVKGKVIQVVGTIIKASVPGVKVGEICILRNPWENFEVQAEVVGFTRDAVLLTALGAMIGISAETEVIPTRRVQMVPVGRNLLGRVLDGLGRPMDADVRGPLRPDGYYPVYAPPPSPLERRIITTPISLGVRAIDGLLINVCWQIHEIIRSRRRWSIFTFLGFCKFYLINDAVIGVNLCPFLVGV